MKTVTALALLVTLSAAPAFAICKHHVASLVSVSDFASPAPAVTGSMIEKCFPHCNG